MPSSQGRAPLGALDQLTVTSPLPGRMGPPALLEPTPVPMGRTSLRTRIAPHTCQVCCSPNAVLRPLGLQELPKHGRGQKGEGLTFERHATAFSKEPTQGPWDFLGEVHLVYLPFTVYDSQGSAKLDVNLYETGDM